MSLPRALRLALLCAMASLAVACSGSDGEVDVASLATPARDRTPETLEPLPPSELFTAGVASGDVTDASAVLWTRTDGPAEVLAQLFAGSSPTDLVEERSFATSAETDFTLHWSVDSLEDDTGYAYRFVVDGAASETGGFRTAPSEDLSPSFRFAISGDSDGRRDAAGNPAWNEFEVLGAIRADDPAFFLYIGDTIYGDRPPPATTLDLYRARYLENRGYVALRELLAALPVYAMIDDHEVVNDFDGQTVDPARYAAGYNAFRDYFPIAGTPDSWAATTGTMDAPPIYRSFRWGSAAEFFILDTRSYRSADAERQCLIGSEPDLIPALGRTGADPSLVAIRAFLNYPAATDSACRSALDDPGRTLLGSEQLAWLEGGLANSDALFKFVVSGEPMQEFFVAPYDRWEGYAFERRRLLEFIASREVENVIFLTTDIHANLINDVRSDHLAGEPPVAVEVTTGPIATGTFAQEVASAVGPGLLQAFLDFARDVAGARCLQIDVYSYALFEVDAANRSTTVSIKDELGNVLCNETWQAR